MCRFCSKESKVYERVANPGDTGKLSLKGLAPWVSHEYRLHREKYVVMETKGVRVVGATGWAIRKDKVMRGMK